MDVEMNKIMDQIMELMHQIATYFIEFAKMEMSGKAVTREQVLENKLINSLFEKVQESYRKLQTFLLEDAKTFNGLVNYNDIEDSSIQTVQGESNNQVYSVNNLTISDLNEYLESAYTKLRYISLYDGGENEFFTSIYKKNNFQTMRNSEYYLQQSNLDDLTARTEIQAKGTIGNFSFCEKADILYWIAKNRFYEDYAFEKMEQYILHLESKFKERTTPESRQKIDELIEHKYILYFEYLNNRYNGILQENDKGHLALAKEMIDAGAEVAMLNMTKFEIDENIKINIEEYKGELKKIIKSTIKVPESKDKRNCKSKTKTRVNNPLNRIKDIVGTMQKQKKGEER